VFVNFTARLDPESNERRRRLERALGLSAAASLARVLNDYEDRLVRKLSDAQRQDYFRGELDQEVICKVLCRDTRRNVPRPLNVDDLTDTEQKAGLAS
jgi:hypothetical protein